MEGAPTTLRGFVLYRVPHLQGVRPETLPQPDLPAETSDFHWLTLRLSPLSGAHLTPPKEGCDLSSGTEHCFTRSTLQWMLPNFGNGCCRRIP